MSQSSDQSKSYLLYITIAWFHRGTPSRACHHATFCHHVTVCHMFVTISPFRFQMRSSACARSRRPPALWAAAVGTPVDTTPSALTTTSAAATDAPASACSPANPTVRPPSVELASNACSGEPEHRTARPYVSSTRGTLVELYSLCHIWVNSRLRFASVFLAKWRGRLLV